MCGPAPEIQPDRRASITEPKSCSVSSGSLTGIIGPNALSKTFLFGAARVGALLDLQQHRVFQHPEAVPASDGDDHVADMQFARRHQLTVVSVDIHFTPTAL